LVIGAGSLILQRQRPIEIRSKNAYFGRTGRIFTVIAVRRKAAF
jgi:hypothetical protein